MSASTPIRVLIVNPNTSQHMTDALRPVVDSLGFENVTYTYFTSPTPGVPSINSPADAEQSANVCLPSLLDLLPTHDAILIACYSQHPLVPQLQSAIFSSSSSPTTQPRQKYVTGIFEASVTASLNVTGSSPTTAFGIVSTGAIWHTALQTAVDQFFGIDSSSPNTAATTTTNHKSVTTQTRFVGCETTGLSASELHDLDPSVVRAKMKDATKRLVRLARERNMTLGAVCLGCAGMVGLEDAVREACVEEMGGGQGEDGKERGEGEQVKIVDGVKAGVASLVGLVRCSF